MRETRTFEIGDCKYKVTSLGAKKAIKVLHVLSRVTAPSMSGIESLDQDLAGRMGEVLERLTESDLDRIVEIMARETEVFDRPGGGGVALGLYDILDDHFAGKRLPDFFKWLIECLKLNFADFLAELGRHFQAPTSSKKEEQNSQSA